MKNNHDFAKHLEKFLSSYLPDAKNVSHNTISSYCDTFRLFLGYCRDIKCIAIERIQIYEIKPDLVIDFLLWLETERKCSISTRNQRLAALHSFAKFLQAESPQDMFTCQMILNVPYKKKVKSLVSYLSVEEMKCILQSPDTTTKNGRRDLMLLSLLYDSGSRVQEIVDLTAKDIHLHYPEKIVLTGKHRKMRSVPIMENTAKLLKNYMEEHAKDFGKDRDVPLFKNRFGKKFTRAGIAYTLDKYAAKARLTVPSIPESVTPHMLRHTKAMHLLMAGVPIIYIRDFLGHVDISTTDIYARANIEMKRDILKKVTDTVITEAPSWSKNPDLMGWLKNLGRPTS